MIPYYDGNIYNSVVRGHLPDIYAWANSQMNPKPHVRSILEQVARCKDHKKKQDLKSKLFYITPSVYIPVGVKRQYANIQYFTGYAQLDFDKLDSIAEAKELRDYIFNQYDCIVMSYLSPSKLGVKGIIKITKVSDVEEYKDIYQAIESEMKQVHAGFDHAPFNCVLPLFISMDADLKVRQDATTWTHKEDRTVDYVHLNNVESDYGRNLSQDEKSLKTVIQFKEKIGEIQDGDGHPRLRSACLVLGSRCGAGYLDIQHANELVEWAVSSNAYLAKKRSTYLKTALWCINQGYNSPQYY